MSEVAPIITALATLVIAIGTVINGRRIKEVKDEVKTGNSQTIAQLTDAAETRRIGHIPIEDQTPLEKSHVKDTKL